MSYSILLHNLIPGKDQSPTTWCDMTRFIKNNSKSRAISNMENYWCWNFQQYPEIEQYQEGDGKCVYIKFEEIT